MDNEEMQEENKLKNLLDLYESFARKMVETKVDIPQIFVCWGNQIHVYFLTAADRNQKRFLLDLLAKKGNPDWIVFLYEGYSKTAENEKPAPEDYPPGSLKKLFKSGDNSVKEVIIINAYTKHGRRARVLSKETLEIIDECADFEGFLTIDEEIDYGKSRQN